MKNYSKYIIPSLIFPASLVFSSCTKVEPLPPKTIERNSNFNIGVDSSEYSYNYDFFINTNTKDKCNAKKLKNK